MDRQYGRFELSCKFAGYFLRFIFFIRREETNLER